MEEQPEEKRKRCLLTLHSELAPVIKTTQLPREVHLPATLPHRQFAAIGLAGCDGRKRPTGKNPPYRTPKPASERVAFKWAP